tara:strand:- start:9872 stop:10033 length:162 start_codon:yes stop_codon:yes gene_type:complete
MTDDRANILAIKEAAEKLTPMNAIALAPALLGRTLQAIENIEQRMTALEGKGE